MKKFDDRKKIIILGAGENGQMVASIMEKYSKFRRKYEILGFCDDNAKLLNETIQNYTVLGGMGVASGYDEVLVCGPFVSGPKTNHIKKQIVVHLDIPLDRYLNIVVPDVEYLGKLEIGHGNLICSGVQMQNNITIGSFTYIANNTVLCSEVKISDFVNVANSSSVMGGVIVSEGAYIGANSSIKGYCRLGKWSVVGMGSVVLQDVNDFEIVAGNPAKVIGRNVLAQKLFEGLGVTLEDHRTSI